MKKFEIPPGLLRQERIDHNGPIFQYIQKCHQAMWELVRLQENSADGNIWDWVDQLTEKRDGSPSIH